MNLFISTNAGDVELGKKASKQFVGRCSLRPDFLVNQLGHYRSRRSPLLMIFKGRPIGHMVFTKQGQFLTCLL